MNEECVNYFDAIPIAHEIYQRVIQVERVEDLSPEDRRNYERDLKFVRDYRNTIQYAEIKAHEQGIQQGIANMIRSMFANGLELDVIANIAGMTVPEVIRILESNDNL